MYAYIACRDFAKVKIEANHIHIFKKLGVSLKPENENGECFTGEIIYVLLTRFSLPKLISHFLQVKTRVKLDIPYNGVCYQNLKKVC